MHSTNPFYLFIIPTTGRTLWHIQPRYSRGVRNNHDEEGISFSVYDFFLRLSQIATTLGTWLLGSVQE
jgi:hypothetical protein